MHFLMTTDVESFSIPLNREDSDVAKQIYEVGLPRLLDLYARRRGERYMAAQKEGEKFWRELSKWLVNIRFTLHIQEKGSDMNEDEI